MTAPTPALGHEDGVGLGGPQGQTLPPLVTLPDLTPPEIAVGLETIALLPQSADTHELAGRNPRGAATRRG